MNLDEVAQSEAQHVLKPFGSNPSVESLLVQSQDARLILPSGDQPKTTADEPAWGELLVRYPRPVLVNRSLAEFFVLAGDVNHIRELASTIAFSDPPGTFPEDSDTPAAGICEPITGSQITLAITVDVPSPRCARLDPSQMLSFTNQTGSSIILSLAWYTIPIGPVETFTFDAPLGAFLSPGVHHVVVQGSGNAPELWLIIPEPTNAALPSATPAASLSAQAGLVLPFVQPGALITAENAGRLRELAHWDTSAVKSAQFIPGLDRVALDLENQVLLYDPQDSKNLERLPLPASDLPWMNQSLLFSPDGSLVARLRGACPSDNQRCHVEVGSRSSGTPLLELETDVFSAISISPDNRYLVLGNTNGLTVYRLSDGKQIAILPESVYFDRIALSPDSSLVAGFVYTGEYVNVYRLPGGELAYRLQPQAYAGAFYPNNAVFSPDGKTLAIGANGLIGIWQAEDGSELGVQVVNEGLDVCVGRHADVPRLVPVSGLVDHGSGRSVQH